MRFIHLLLLALHTSTLCFSSSFSGPLLEQDERGLLRDHCQLVAEAAQRAYTRINQHWSYPDAAIAEKGSTTSPYWTLEDELFLLVPNKTYFAEIAQNGPIDFCAAFNSLLDSPAQLECRLAMQVSKIMCTCALLGEDSFNKLARSIWEDVHAKEEEQFFLEVLSEKFWGHAPVPQRSAQLIGRSLYIANVSDYVTRFPKGSFRGHNLMCVGLDLFMGFGDIFKNGPVSIEDVLKDLHRAYADTTLSFDKFLLRQGLAQREYALYSMTGVLDVRGIRDFKETKQLAIAHDLPEDSEASHRSQASSSL
ncbi:MAG: hypothetical protein C0514_01495 [Candidatus Puniceispirillum sp.]|nr:hypothetical protein [Candidatus Puniceispirillum sp.]